MRLVTVSPHRWYEVTTPRGAYVVRVLTLDEEAETTNLTRVPDDGGWARLAQPTHTFRLADWVPAVTRAMPEDFEPPAILGGLGALLKQPLPQGDMAGRLRKLGELHPGAASELATLARHIDRRPVFVAEETAALTGAVLGWLLHGRGPVHEAEVRAHRWVDLQVDVASGTGSRRCEDCGIRDGLMGMAPRYCLGSENKQRGDAPRGGVT